MAGDLERAREQGVAAIDYALLGSLIAAVIALIVATLGTQVRDLISTIVGAF